MDSKKEKLLQLLNKTTWTQAEKLWIRDYLNENSDHTEVLRRLMWEQFEKGEESGDHHFDARKVLANIHSKIEQKQLHPSTWKTTLRRQWFAFAAVCIGVLFFSTYFLLNREHGTMDTIAMEDFSSMEDIVPGGEKAILIRGDGSKTVLESTYTGEDSLLRIENGKITYNANNHKGKEQQFNTVTTPKSGRYQVELPDGTNVWLNAASSIRFPTAFTGDQRRVEIQGEAFFDVAKDANKPFIVQVNGAEITVLGTQFNVMAYPDEQAMKTTLLEGSVRFSNQVKEQVILKPGQQSLLRKGGSIEVLKNVNMDNVIAWKDGFFDFDGDDIETVTRQLARWYDVEIVLEKSSKDLFYAKIPRSTMLSDVLKALELTGKVRFEIKDRKIKVIV